MSIKKNFFTVLLLSLFYLLLSTYSYAKVTTLTATSTVISDQGILPISAKTDVIKLTIVEGDPVEDSSSFTKAVVSLSSAAYISNVYLYRDDGSGVFGSGDSKVAEERVSTSSVVTLEGFSESITNQTKTYFIVIETSERIRNNYEFNVTLSSVTVSNLGDGVSFSPVTTTNIRCVDWVGDVTADADYIYAI
ncbi:MAG TPA: hypothetical protein EYP78_04760, partial [Candidatus Omnitrophica bacterium]|nr:hypothetical protein [Candidatus Omnitrophota bacterium]